MKISSLSFALIMALTGGFGAVLQPHNMTGANLELYNVAKDDYDVPRGKCSVRRNVWSRTWWVTLTNVSNDPVNEICDRLWAGLARRKCFSLQTLYILNNKYLSSITFISEFFSSQVTPVMWPGHLHFFDRFSSLAW